MSPTGKPAWTIGTLENLGIPMYTRTSIPRQEDVQIKHLEDRMQADEAGERADLTPFFANLMTGGYATTA